MNISLQDVYSALNPCLMIIATGLAGWAVKSLTAWLNTHAKFMGATAISTVSDLLDKVLADGVIAGQQKLTDEERALPSVKVNGIVAGYAAEYVLAHPSGLVKQLTGSTPEKLAQMALTKLPSIK